MDAVKTLVREQEWRRVESLFESHGIDDHQLEQVLQQAEESGDYAPMTAADWEDVEREGLAILNARKAA